MRLGAGWLTAGIAALLLTTGCKEGRSVTVNEQGEEQVTASKAVEQAQDRSEQAFDRAESAQKEAGDQQEEAVQAQKDVEEARRQLTEAEAKAQAELQQAQQAQQQAQQTHQQAQQTVAEAQKSALEAQRQQQAELAQQAEQQAQQQAQSAQQQAQQPVAQQPVAQQPVAQQPVAQAPLPSTQAQSEQFIIGQVLTASEDEVMVSVRGEPQLRLQVEPSTQILVDGRQGRAADIQEGSQVRASYRDNQGEQQAVRIEVTSSQQPGMPAAPESGESSPGVQPQ